MDDLIKSLVENTSPPYLANKNWKPGKPIRLLGVAASRFGVSDQQKLELEFE